MRVEALLQKLLHDVLLSHDAKLESEKVLRLDEELGARAWLQLRPAFITLL